MPMLSAVHILVQERSRRISLVPAYGRRQEHWPTFQIPWHVTFVTTMQMDHGKMPMICSLETTFHPPLGFFLWIDGQSSFRAYRTSSLRLYSSSWQCSFYRGNRATVAWSASESLHSFGSQLVSGLQVSSRSMACFMWTGLSSMRLPSLWKAITRLWIRPRKTKLLAGGLLVAEVIAQVMSEAQAAISALFTWKKERNGLSKWVGLDTVIDIIGRGIKKDALR